uniref:Uncharacterized protein n=1 Tax=viral metagenome TaxID=1070528 RepID=A0A6C0LMZ2_9ZZZZ
MNFDLNIDNYSKGELVEMFELPPDYDNNIFEIKEAKMRANLMNNNEITETVLNNTLDFLARAKSILLGGEPKSNKAVDFLENVYNSQYKLKPSTVLDPGEHMVLERDNKPYLDSFPSQFFPGVINPLKKKIRVMNLNIDSKFRDNYYSTSASNFNANLNQNIDNVLTMQLDAIELPITFYSVSKQYENNFFLIELPDTDEKQLVEIPSGNYNYEGLENAINNQLSIIGGVYASIVFKINVTDNQNGSGQMLVGIEPTAVPFNFELNFQTDRNGTQKIGFSLALKMGWLMGFRNGKYVGNQNYVSEGIVDVLGSRYLFLAIDDYNSNVNDGFYSAFNGSLLNKNILARISLQGGTFSVLSQNNLGIVTTPREYFGPVNIQNVNIQLLDTYGRLVDLNNMDYSFCLKLQMVYDI